MPTRRNDRDHPQRPWRARARIGIWRYHLGYHPTREAALAAEQQFRAVHDHARSARR
jgi:hypothetical protein